VAVHLISRERCWFLACELAFLSAIVSFTVPHSAALTGFGDITQCLLLFAVLACVLANVHTADPRARLFWILNSAAWGLWLVAQLLWTYFEVFLGREVPNFFSGDAILFLHLVPLIGAIALRPDVEGEGHVSRLGLLDFVMLLTWWVYLYCFLVVPWQYVWPDSAVYGRSFDHVYVLEHLTFVLCAGIAWWRASGGGWKIIYGQMFGAGLLYAIGSAVAGAAIDAGKYYTGSFYDVPLMGAMAWFAGVGWSARKLHLRAESTEGERRTLWFSGLAMATILSLPIMVAWAVYISRAPAPVRGFRLLLTLMAMMLMGGLNWIKQHRSDKELARTNRDLREDSLTDILTGARNRRFLNVTIESDLRQVVRSYSSSADPDAKRNRDLAFYLIDADSFKEVNDRYGHDAGDKLLVEIARRISSAIRHSDVLIRWGGDEFLVVSRYTDRNDCAILAARVLKFVGGQPFDLGDGAKVDCTCSIGWAVFPWYVRGPETVAYGDILRLTDCALYEAKKAGKNQAVGMLPSCEDPLDSRNMTRTTENLAEQLATRSVRTLGPARATDTEAPPKALAANPGS
jgi:diguanylate cyclase (GGDEF)-like protein